MTTGKWVWGVDVTAPPPAAVAAALAALAATAATATPLILPPAAAPPAPIPPLPPPPPSSSSRSDDENEDEEPCCSAWEKGVGETPSRGVVVVVFGEEGRVAVRRTLQGDSSQPTFPPWTQVSEDPSDTETPPPARHPAPSFKAVL
ncbi:hypothetical protein M501DRAFT_1013567 [Patellaria atrata CBS 101060]|uniref:Uncharacterized protein n=1 Tax=Patellaria atrata CBS 101060 TaxID=1346257 RepID=A0A9P4SI30_9PEZI|nr:hypothetical protein M501DRAFT_1013567 [Patellaria atrata CBS 101060]